MKKGDVIRQKCVNNSFYVTGIWAHKVNNIIEYISVAGAFCIIYVISVTISYHSMAEFAEFAFCLVRVLRQKKWIL